MATSADKLLNAGYEDVVIFDTPAYDGALIGVSHDGRAIYSYDLMVEGLVTVDGMTEEEAVEWIDYNTIRSIPYYEGAPIIMYGLD